MDNTYQAPQGRFLPALVVFIFVVGVLFTLFLFIQQLVLNRDLNRIERDRLDLESEIALLREQQLQELFTAQEIKDILESEAVEWSKVIRQLQDVTPITVFFSTYSAGSKGSISLSGLGDSYAAVADVITAMERSSNFENVFVPSATLGTTGDGQEVVSFSLSIEKSEE